jgi:N-acetyl sugar amidotransferase
MKYCHNCLQPDTRPNTKFDEYGICPACNYFATLKDIDWDERRKELEGIVEFGRANNHSGYDCIIGVSGGKDSTRQAIYVKEVLKMRPLLVSLGYPPEQVSERGVENVSNMIYHGFDCVLINPAPRTWNKLMRKSFLEFGNWAKSTEYALFSSVPRLAIAYQIPLIWWGENPGLQLGDLGTIGKSGGDGNRLKYSNTLGGGDISWLLTEVKKKDILQYVYPSDEEMETARLRIVYLGYYWNDWSLVNNGNFSALRGLDVRQEHPRDIGDTFGITALDEDWVGMNQMIKYYKFGFGRMSDYANEEIRLGRISRTHAAELVRMYDGKCSDTYTRSFCQYLDLTTDEFWTHIEKYVNKDLFEKTGDHEWTPKFEVGVGL